MPDYEVKQPEQPGPTGLTLGPPIFWKDPSLDDGFTPDAVGVEISADDSAAPLLVNGVNVVKELKRARFHVGVLTIVCVGLIAWNIVHLLVHH